MNRKESNMEIIRLLANYINENPEQRFTQLLRNLDVIGDVREGSGKGFWYNEFYTESEDTLKRIKKVMTNAD